MENLNNLKKKIEAKKEVIKREKEVEEKYQNLLSAVKNIAIETKENLSKIIKVEVKNNPKPLTEIKVSNLSEIKYPKIEIPKTVIPEYPKEIEVKKPKWFDLKGIRDDLYSLKTAIIKALDIDLSKFTKKQNALAVRLVTRDGKDYYNAGGGGGGTGNTNKELIEKLNDTTAKTQAWLADENGVKSQMLSDTYFAGSPVVVDVEHHEIHCGDSLAVTNTVDLDNGATRDILFVTPENALPALEKKRYHFYIEITSESEADFSFYEGVTTSNNGTAIGAKNRNRVDIVVPENEILFFHTPTVTVLGTLLESDHWGSGRGVGGGSRANNEWVVKNNTKYLIRVTNATAVSNFISIKINYYVQPVV